MVSSPRGDWKRTILSAFAALVAALLPAASLAAPPASGDKASRDARLDDERLVDDGVKKVDPKVAKATKRQLPSGNAKATLETDRKAALVEKKKPALVEKKKAAPDEPKLVEKEPKLVAKKTDGKPEPGAVDPKKLTVKVKPHKDDPKVALKPLEPKRLDAKVAAAPKKPKAVASRSSLGAKKASHKAEPPKPCNGAWVNVDRGGLESEKMPLLDCKGRPLASSQEHLSVLVRPWGAARPKIAPHEGLTKPDARGEIAPGVRLLDTGLLTRLDAIARHFPGKAFSFVSGYRPQSRGSNHQTGRAVDVRLVGVKNEDLVAFCRTLKDTGCGYYPNSSFVHVDVRNPGTGSVTWIDASGPGESPRYVSTWPPAKVHGTDPAGKEDRVAPPAEDEPHDDVISDQLPKNRLGEVPDHPLL